MKKPETTATYIMICIVVLVAAYGLGYCINEIKASRTEAAQNKILIQEIKKTEAYSPANQNQANTYTFAQDRNTRTNTDRNIQDFGQRNNMMGQPGQMNGNFGNQGMNNRGMNMVSGSSGMGRQNFDPQSMTNNFPFYNNQYMPGTQDEVEEPNNSNRQGGY